VFLNLGIEILSTGREDTFGEAKEFMTVMREELECNEKDQRYSIGGKSKAGTASHLQKTVYADIINRNSVC
jgi:hypothetical protein